MNLLDACAPLMLLLLFSLIGCTTTHSEDRFLGVPTSEIQSELNSLLQNWYPRIVDTVRGGYWTNYEYDWTRSEDQPKMLVTQARGLWTAARAASVFPDRPVYREAADHGYRFLTQQMWDRENTGFYQLFPDGISPAGTLGHKMTYGNAFALYALSEYAKVNDSPEVLGWVQKAFDWLETTAYDSINGGYYNLILPDTLTDPEEIRSIGWGDPSWKDQNTSIHVLEALTTTYQVLPEEKVKVRLEEMLRLVRDTMVHPEGFLHLYFTSDWQPFYHRDSSRAYIMDHLQFDHRSFGHDIETAYLLLDAAETLYGSPDTATLHVAENLVQHTLDYGFDENYYGLFDRGYKFRESDEVEIVDNKKNWWGQAEAWHTLALFATMHPEEEMYPQAFQQMWKYITTEMIDGEYGGWFNNGLDTDPENRTARKGHQWKGAYHNGRALIQTLEMAGGQPAR